MIRARCLIQVFSLAEGNFVLTAAGPALHLQLHGEPATAHTS
jgi:hypothetical protein